MIESNWLTKINEGFLDFKFGEDIEVKDLPTLHKQDKKYFAVNQDTWDFKQACTMMAPYADACSLYNIQPSSAIKNKILKYATEEEDYKIGQWWGLKDGINASAKVRNRAYPDKKIMYAVVRIGSSIFKEVIEKWYPVVMGLKTSPGYARDRMDGIVEATSFDNFVGHHAISSYKSEKWNDWMHINTYPKRENNRFEVKNWYELVDNGVYLDTGYVILPEQDLAGKKKQKFKKALRVLSGYMKNKMYADEDDKKKLSNIQDLISKL